MPLYVITDNVINQLMWSNWTRFMKYKMSLNSILSLRNIFGYCYHFCKVQRGLLNVITDNVINQLMWSNWLRVVIDRNVNLNRNRNTEISVWSEPKPKPKPKDRAYRNRNRNRNRKTKQKLKLHFSNISCLILFVKQETVLYMLKKVIAIKRS